MKRALRLSVLILGLLASFGAYADQFALPWGWTGGYGVLGQCLLSNGPATLPSWQACPGGGGSGTVTSIIAGTGLTGGTITSTGTIALSTPIADGSLSTNVALLNAANSFTGATQTVSSTEPRVRLNQTGAGTDLKLWDIDVASGVLTVRTRTDADGAGVNVISVTRGTTTAITDISLGNATNNPTVHFLGSGALTGASVSANFVAYNVASSGPTIAWDRNNAGTDLKWWIWKDTAGVYALSTATDAASGTPVKNAIAVTRGTTTTIASTAFGNATDNPTTQFLGTGLVTVSGPTKHAVTVVASLPTCNSGANGELETVTDAAASPVYNATVAGGGTVTVLALCNGTNWTNH